MVRALLCLLLAGVGLTACAPEDEIVYDENGNPAGEEIDRYGKVTKSYWVSNPSGLCATALKLTGKGTKVTKVTPSGAGVTWDSLTGSSSSLYDTWYYRSLQMDKDWTSATGYYYFDSVKVVVEGDAVTNLYYWFYDYTGSGCDHD